MNSFKRTFLTICIACCCTAINAQEQKVNQNVKPKVVQTADGELKPEGEEVTQPGQKGKKPRKSAESKMAEIAQEFEKTEIPAGASVSENPPSPTDVAVEMPGNIQQVDGNTVKGATPVNEVKKSEPKTAVATAAKKPVKKSGALQASKKGKLKKGVVRKPATAKKKSAPKK